MDLLSRLNPSTKTKAIEPREIFMTLPSKEAGYGYPRDVQSEVWKKWFEKREEKNIILKMNTGSGKTVVGLVMLQSCLNENKGPAIYVVPDKYLVNQVIDEAKRLGISVTADKNDQYNYLHSKAILVTTIHTLVNGHSYFGMRTKGSLPIGSIIIDDVHACMDKITGQYMIKIDAESEAYRELIALFGSFLKDYNPRGYIDIVEMKNCQKNMLVPYWEWQRQQDEVYRILTKYNTSDNEAIYFGLPLIDRSLETCDCMITASSIEISPKGIDLEKISSLGDAKRRIYMSATLADDSVFISTLGLDVEDMKNIITPESANDIGSRLVIFPKFINNAISEVEIKEKVEEIAEKYNVVILVPSFSRARFWDESGERTAQKFNIDEIVEELKSGKYIGKTIFVNRYDGIDLPGDSCRLLVVDGLPPLNSIKDRYIQSVAPESTILLREQVQRIEQGMGRGVRSNDDTCCIVLMGDELSDVLLRNKGVDYFSVATRCQYNLSKELWDLLVETIGTKPNIREIFELSNDSLEKNPKWIEICKERLSAVKYSNEAKVDEKIVAQRKAFKHYINEQWHDAIAEIKKVKDKEPDNKTKGYLCQLLAEYTNKIDSVNSQLILKAGKKLNSSILSPIDGINYERLQNITSQSKSIRAYLINKRIKTDELLVYIDSVLSNLYIGNQYEKFEEALNQVGGLLGFACSRPDKENSGHGPDNLWALDSRQYLVIECKSEATVETIKKDYCNQLGGAINWFKSQYSVSEEPIPIIIHNSNIIDSGAFPDENMRVMTEIELTLFRNHIRDFYSALYNHTDINDIDKINELLSIYKLRKVDIVNVYTVKFRRMQ